MVGAFALGNAAPLIPNLAGLDGWLVVFTYYAPWPEVSGDVWRPGEEPCYEGWLEMSLWMMQRQLSSSSTHILTAEIRMDVAGMHGVPGQLVGANSLGVAGDVSNSIV